MDDNTTQHSDKMSAIAKYLSRGWALVPLHYIVDGRCSCGDVQCRSAGKHPITTQWQKGGFSAASWQMTPQANIGIITGAPSGFWTLDHDPANAIDGGAQQVVHGLEFAGLEPHVQTGGYGEHWYFRLPVDFEVTNRRGTLPAGLDVRGTGGYVVAPPSVSGKGPYVELSDAEPYDAPMWLLDMIRPPVPKPSMASTGVPGSTGAGPAAGWSDDRGPRYARAAVGQLLTELCNAHGNRNDLAYRAACRIIELRNAGWLNDGSTAYVDWETATLAHPGGIVVPYSEAAAVWASAERHIGGRPAALPDEWVEVWPAPPTSPAGVPPFSSISPNGARSAMPADGAVTVGVATSGSVGALTPMVQFTEPGTSIGGSTSAIAGTAVDPWEFAVQQQVNRELVRAEARRRLAEIEAGDRATVKARLRAETLDTAGLLARPPLVPLVAGALYLDSLARLNGAPGAGKSFLALDLAARVAAGMPWAGRATTRVPVRYVVAEGDAGMRKRVLAWQARHGRAVEVSWLPRAVQIGGPEWSAWCEVLAEDGDRLIVLDTQARGTVGRNEIDGKDMGEVGQALDQLRQVTGACVLLVHHTPIGVDRARGHGSVTGALQTEWIVKKAGREITLRSTKDKDDESPDDIVFDLVDVPEPAGGMEGFSEPGPPASVGVVPVWRGEVPIADALHEPAYRSDARALWIAVHAEINPGLGATEAEIRGLAATLPRLSGLDVRSKAQGKAINRAWNELIRLGLLARGYRERRFKVVVLDDQSADGVLTSNRDGEGAPKHDGPPGFEVCGDGDRKPDRHSP